VVGGGDAAVEEAIFLTKFASKVYLVHRRGGLRATKLLQERAFANEKMDFVWDSVITEVMGEGFVRGVCIKNLKTGDEFTLSVEGIFVYIGSIPNTLFLEGQLKLDDDGYIVTDRMCHTSVPGVFAAGDVQEPFFQQASTVIGSGGIAAMEAENSSNRLRGRRIHKRHLLPTGIIYSGCSFSGRFKILFT
jgi:thioredoxin reductase (NADPH)